MRPAARSPPPPSASIEGPGGSFANGLRTEVAVTDAQGRVSMHGLQVNRCIPGRFQIRIIANKEQARAGVVSSQYVAEPRSGVAAAAAPRSHARWVVVAALVGGGAAAGIFLGKPQDPGSCDSPRHPACAHNLHRQSQHHGRPPMTGN